MRKNIYRAQNVKLVNVEKLKERVQDREIVFGIDVAKEDMFSVLMNEDEEVMLTIKWKHPAESHQMLDLLTSLPTVKLEAAMEPSGTYGDSFRYHLLQAGISVFRVGAKKSHDYCEIYDGVPSSHDAKSAAIVAKLHRDKKSEPWPVTTDEQRELRAAIMVMEMHRDSYHRQLNRLEAMLSRHWPELSTLLELTSASILELLIEYGSPQAVTAAPDKARKLLRRVGGCLLKQEKIDKVIALSSTTLGVPPIEQERQMVMKIAAEARRSSKKAKKAQKCVEKLTQETDTVAHMGAVVGKVTAAVLYSYLGDPRSFSCASAYVKSSGLNLKERSSGKHKGRLKITKRGPSTVRRYLYLAVLRLIQDDVIFQAWYQRKVQRDGGKKIIAIIALMRKLTKALWHVGQGNIFDSRLLFDLNRLKFPDTEAIYD